MPETISVIVNKITYECAACNYQLVESSMLVKGTPTNVVYCPNSDCENYAAYGQTVSTLGLIVLTPDKKV